ncbi:MULTISPECIES: hypothetical protein [Pseudomonas]|uniref:hypothetical protein n=1 Tax=Pseudomonas TaxID=286 RepID=UPI000C885294|nr:MULTISPECIES: hypothetical protein [Pseudomonas]PMY40080.1 hypothetical protein C1Y36_24000 [Pseudomonas sp. FW306-2-2C-D06C]PYC41803.1 hypothetical protein DMW99_00120 [Pseudomonas chlororaphis]
MAALYLVGVQAALPPSILADDFPAKLSAFNDLTRDFRQADIEIKHLVLADNKIFIEPSSVELLTRRFGHELRRMRSSSKGRFTCHTVTVRGVDVAWYSLVKEQGQ